MSTLLILSTAGMDRCLRDIQADYERLLAELDASLAAHGITSH